METLNYYRNAAAAKNAFAANKIVPVAVTPAVVAAAATAIAAANKRVAANKNAAVAALRYALPTAENLVVGTKAGRVWYFVPLVAAATPEHIGSYYGLARGKGMWLK